MIRSLRFLSFTACALLAACGGQASSGKSSNVPVTSMPPSATGQGDTTTVGAPVPGGSTSTTSTEGLPGDVAHAQIEFEDSHKAFTAASGDCASMCKALSSMQRAADHLCGLTKDGADGEKKRCDEAQSKVSGARDRVKATCGGCDG